MHLGCARRGAQALPIRGRILTFTARETLVRPPWPPADLERVGTCPACGASERRAWHAGLVDDVFGCAPGTWDFFRCGRCGAAYLDPRPTRGSILRAYARYYTHGAPEPDPGEGRGLQGMLRRGYLRTRWGYGDGPAWRGAAVLVGRRRRAAIDLEVRHLPRPDGSARLLDVGCGNGAFLARMRSRGWEAHGLEPDPRAAESARTRGLDVHAGTLDDAPWPDGFFRAVTLSSVIEHVHDPPAALETCFRLLEPGGILHVVTPNVDAIGAERFGVHWRGLEAPRHLVLFGRVSLTRALAAQGFTDVMFHPRYAGEWFWLVSGAIAQGLEPDDIGALDPDERRSLRREGRAADRRVEREPHRAEELVATARRPSVEP